MQYGMRGLVLRVVLPLQGAALFQAVID
jgi:hypothetical protein